MEVYFFLWGCAEMSLLGVGGWLWLSSRWWFRDPGPYTCPSIHVKTFKAVFRGASEEGRLGDCAQKSFIFKIKRVKGVCITYDHIKSAAHLSHDHKEVWEMWSCHFPGERGNRWMDRWSLAWETPVTPMQIALREPLSLTKATWFYHLSQLITSLSAWESWMLTTKRVIWICQFQSLIFR